MSVPGTSRKSDSENREATADCSLNDPCQEVVFPSHHSVNLNGSELEEPHHMVTGAQEAIRYRPHMATGVQEETPYCSPGTSSGKQKKARSTSQPQFRSGNTPASIEADQILLALQQLAMNTKPGNFNNNINRISKWPKSLRIKMPTFDGKPGKLELFEDLF